MSPTKPLAEILLDRIDGWEERLWGKDGIWQRVVRIEERLDMALKIGAFLIGVLGAIIGGAGVQFLGPAIRQAVQPAQAHVVIPIVPTP